MRIFGRLKASAAPFRVACFALLSNHPSTPIIRQHLSPSSHATCFLSPRPARTLPSARGGCNGAGCGRCAAQKKTHPHLEADTNKAHTPKSARGRGSMSSRGGWGVRGVAASAVRRAGIGTGRVRVLACRPVGKGRWTTSIADETRGGAGLADFLELIAPDAMDWANG